MCGGLQEKRLSWQRVSCHQLDLSGATSCVETQSIGSRLAILGHTAYVLLYLAVKYSGLTWRSSMSSCPCTSAPWVEDPWLLASEQFAQRHVRHHGSAFRSVFYCPYPQPLWSQLRPLRHLWQLGSAGRAVRRVAGCLGAAIGAERRAHLAASRRPGPNPLGNQDCYALGDTRIFV